MLITNLFKHWTYQVLSPGAVLREKYEAFKSLLNHDKCAHELMAELEEIYHNNTKVDFKLIEDKYSVVFSRLHRAEVLPPPVAYFKNIESQKIIVICDRYNAYKSLARQLDFIILAFCWAHVRRDFLDAEKKYLDLEKWETFWVEKIGALYHINNLRCKEFDQKLPLQWQTSSFKEQHEKLVGKMAAIAKERDAFIEAHNPDSDLLSNVKYKILTSLQNHWKSRSVCQNFLYHLVAEFQCGLDVSKRGSFTSPI